MAAYTQPNYAMYWALLYTSRQSQSHFLMCLDSLSAKQGLFSHPPTAQIICQLSHLCERNYYVVFCWVLGHASFPSNEATDVTAKEVAVGRTPSCDQALVSNIHVHLYRAIYLWQSKWVYL